MAITVNQVGSNIPLGVNFQLMKGLLSSARKKLPYFNGTLPGQLQKNGGTASVKWERLENLNPATTALGEATSGAAFFGRSSVQPTVSTVTVAMSKYGNAVLLTEEIDLQQMNLRAMRFVDNLGANAGESLNVIMSGVFSAGATTIRYSNGIAGNTISTDALTIAAITLTDIKYAVNQLNRNSAMLFTSPGYGSTNVGTNPIRQSYYGICHVDVEEDVRGLTGFVPVEQYGGYTETMPFEFGAVGGVRWCSTEMAPISTGAGTTSVGSATKYRGTTSILNDVYQSYVYGKEAVGTVGMGNMHATTAYEMYDPKAPPAVELIVKGLGQVGTDLYNEISSAAWKAWFAGKVLNAGWIIAIRSLSAQV
jgi:N4-gp56 family major capsid protein